MVNDTTELSPGPAWTCREVSTTNSPEGLGNGITGSSLLKAAWSLSLSFPRFSGENCRNLHKPRRKRMSSSGSLCRRWQGARPHGCRHAGGHHRQELSNVPLETPHKPGQLLPHRLNRLCKADATDPLSVYSSPETTHRPGSILWGKHCNRERKFSTFVGRCRARAPAGSVVKNPPANTGDVSSISGSGRSPGGGNGNPPQYPSLENPMDRGAWRAAVLGVTERQTRLK